MLIDGIHVEADCSISEEVVLQEVANERLFWQAAGRTIATINMTVDNGELVIEAYERSPIRRVRRITGYLSNIDNFNDAKKKEVDKRVVHFEISGGE